MRAGLVADAWSVRGSIVSGGVACVVGVAATSLWLRDFWSYDNRTDEHATADGKRGGVRPETATSLRLSSRGHPASSSSACCR